MADIAVREVFRARRVAGGALVFIALPLTLIWLRLGLPLQYGFGDLIFALGGPGLLVFGLWAAFPQRAPAVRMLISDDRLVVHPGPHATVVFLADLICVTKTRPLAGKHDRMVFETADGKAQLDIAQMTHEADDIINLISIRLEARNKFLREGRTDVMGAPNGIWDVEEGNPFEKRP